MSLSRTFPFLAAFLIFCAYMAITPFMQDALRANKAANSAAEIATAIQNTYGDAQAVEAGMDVADKYFAGIHADEKHPLESRIVRDCIAKNGVHSIWKQANGRILQLCQVSDTQWGVRICETGLCTEDDEVTAFLKDKMTRFEQVAKYLENKGCKPF